VRAQSWLRAGLIFFAAGDVLIGALAYLLPRSFYDDVPTVALDPPFSQHFVSDVGAFYLSQAVVLAAAAIVMERRLVRAALGSYLTFALLHLVFHVSHLAGMPASDAVGLTTALILDAAIPAAFLIVACSPQRALWPATSPARAACSAVAQRAVKAARHR
jgi:hypothetical protein